MEFFNVDIAELVKTVGYVGLFSIVFAESGVFFGFFLPGGSMLFTAGLLASQGFFNIYTLVITLGTAAILGDSAGYWFGSKIGPKIFKKEDSLLFKKKHLEQTKKFYDKYGARAVVLGRFIPIVRTFVPILAGVAGMHYGKFIRYNIIGATLWAIGMTLLGYFVGVSVPNMQNYLLPIVITIVLLSVLPIFLEMRKKPKEVRERREQAVEN